MARKNWIETHRTGKYLARFDYSRAAITMAGCLETIRDLARAGDNPVSLKLAAWAGVMSIKQPLDRNGRAARILARFIHADLPPTEAGIKALLKPARCGVMPVHAAGLLAIETLDAQGALPATPQDDWTLDHWYAWRREMQAIPGVGWKVASFIGLLCCPETCPLVPVDMWVMERLGFDTESAPSSEANYMAVETLVREERDAAGYSHLPLGAWHWYKWSEARQAAVLPSGKPCETPSAKPESHDMLSPRWY